MKENYKKILEEFKENSGDGYYPNEIMVQRLMEIEKLAEINDGLAEINDGLADISFELGEIASSLSILANCVGHIPPTPLQTDGYHVLRIVGQVDAWN